MKFQDPQLRQRGRASIDFLALIAGGSMKVREAMDAEMVNAGLTADLLPDNMDARYDAVSKALGQSRSYATLNLLGDWHGRMHGPIAVEAFEEISADLKPAINAPIDFCCGPGIVVATEIWATNRSPLRCLSPMRVSSVIKTIP